MTLEPFATHEVFNQTPPFVDVNLAALDKPLLGALEAFGDAGAAPSAIAQAAGLGAAENFELARLANENPPKLKVFNA
ncbi:MAG: DNA alkylation response protein, partial [Hyphomicrobiales bacterium]|nr:DNA alkylation response protein [Hyphomicrobiales bacterium]